MRNQLKCLFICMLAILSSCALDNDSILFIAGSLNVADCNNEHSLKPAVEKAVSFYIYARNYKSEPIEGLVLNVSCSVSKCDGTNLYPYSANIATDENGVVTGEIPLSYTWDTDKCHFEVAVLGETVNYIAYTEYFDYTKDHVDVFLTISSLED